MNNSKEQDENIEDRIKSIISDKLKCNDFKNSLNKDKIEIIEKLFEIFPDLKDQKKFLNDVNKNKNILIDNNDDEIVLDELIYENKIYYKDKHNYLWNEDANLVGTIKKDTNTDEYVYYMFDKKFEGIS